MDVVERLAQMTQQHVKRSAVQEQQLLLKLWGDEYRGLAKCLVNSALFAVRDKRLPRAQFDNEKIASYNDVTIRYTGEQLDQDDQLVFAQIMDLAGKVPVTAPVLITASDMLSGLSWSDASESYDRLRRCIDRMLAGTVHIEDHKPERTRTYRGHIINSYVSDTTKRDTDWQIYLNHSMCNLISGDELTLIKWVRHKQMSSLAQYLHAFYSSHLVPLPYKVETLYERCGSRRKSMVSFRQSLKLALGELVEHGFLEHYEIGKRPSYLVSVRRAKEE